MLAMRSASFRLGAFVLCLLLQTVPSSCLLNGQATTPPLGFNDWNEIAAKYKKWSSGVNETEIKAIAHALVDTGLRDKGYIHVNLDCGYSNGTRSSDGRLVADARKFPSGLRALGEFIHSLKLKFGIYTSGRQCCSLKGANDGLIGYEEQDAQQFAELGIDYIKNDDCGSTDESFLKFRDAINKTGRPTILSIHTIWTHDHKSGFGPKESVPIANSWRTTNDIRNDWADILDRALKNDVYADLAAPGGWNDPDMLEVGNSGVSDVEGRSHFSLWCLMKAPLLIGTDLTAASAATVATLGNTEAIAINQDPLGVQGTLRTSGKGIQVWAGPLAYGCHTALMLNLKSSGNITISLEWKILNASNVTASTSLRVRDLWAHEDLGSFTGSFSATIAEPHGSMFLKLCPH